MALGFGLVGCGNIARFHEHGILSSGGKVVHVADINKHAAQSFVDRHGCAGSQDYRRLLDDPSVQVVCILTSSAYHKEIALAALAAGKDVVCEKTMMDNPEEAFEVATAFAGSDRLFFTAFMKRFFPAVVKLKELLPSIGRIFSCDVRTFQSWGDFYTAADPGQFSFVLGSYGGAVLKCAGSHMLDMMIHLLGRPCSVSSYVDYMNGTRFDRKATALFSYETGMTVSFEAATHPLHKIGYEHNSWDEYIKIFGVAGVLELHTVMWDHPERNGVLLEYYDNTTGATTKWYFDPVNPFDLEIAWFSHCVEHRIASTPDAVDGFNTDTVIDAVVKASDARKTIDINWRGL